MILLWTTSYTKYWVPSYSIDIVFSLSYFINARYAGMLNGMS